MGASNAFSTVPKASAQPGELFVSAVPREPRARAKPSDEKRSAQKTFFPKPMKSCYFFAPKMWALQAAEKVLVCEALYQGTSLLVP